MIIFWLIIVLLLLLALRIPLFLSLMTVSVAYVFIKPVSVASVIQQLSGGLESFPLLAVPLFILVGSIMAKGNLAEQMINFAGTFVGHWRGGLAQVNVLNSLFMGGMSGTAAADAAVDAKVLVPVMRKHGYSNGYASALTVASSTVAPMLPPSVGLIIYGVMADVSISTLFVAGIAPAVLVIVALSVTVRVLAGIHNHPRARDERASFREVLAVGGKASPVLLMPILLLVGLRMGVFTPTEMSAVAVFYTLVVAAAIYRKITWKDIPRILKDAALTSGMLMIIIAGASAFGIMVAYERLPKLLESTLLSISENPVIILLVINVLLLILGLFLDSMSLLLIVVPTMAPIIVGLGMDPVHFGVVVLFNIVLGSVTPPVGGTLFAVMAITRVSMTDLVKGFLPLYIPLFGVLILISAVPAIVLWLPSIF